MAHFFKKNIGWKNKHYVKGVSKEPTGLRHILKDRSFLVFKSQQQRRIEPSKSTELRKDNKNKIPINRKVLK